MSNTAFNVTLFPTEAAHETVRLAKLAEKLGYDGVWVGDSHIIWRELYVLLGAIASQTKRITLGSGVTHPQVRHLTVTASSFVTLCELAQGRVRIGIGVGASGPINIGLEPTSLAQLEQGVAALRRLFKGESIQLNGKETRLMFASNQEIPIYVSASRPRSRELAARIGDGAIMGSRKDLLGAWVDHVRGTARAAGRAEGSVKTVYWTICSVSKDEAAAREAVKPHIANRGMNTFEKAVSEGQAVDEEDRKAAVRLRREYDFRHHMGPEHSHLVPDRWVDRFAVAGTGKQVQDKIDEMIKSGVDIISIVPYGDKEAIIKDFARQVMARLR